MLLQRQGCQIWLGRRLHIGWRITVYGSCMRGSYPKERRAGQSPHSSALFLDWLYFRPYFVALCVGLAMRAMTQQSCKISMSLVISKGTFGGVEASSEVD